MGIGAGGPHITDESWELHRGCNLLFWCGIYIYVDTLSAEDTRLCVELPGGHVAPSLAPLPGSPVGAGHHDFSSPETSLLSSFLPCFFLL
jgi:hypothetical protein